MVGWVIIDSCHIYKYNIFIIMVSGKNKYCIFFISFTARIVGFEPSIMYDSPLNIIIHLIVLLTV